MVQFLCSYGNAAALKEAANATSNLYESPSVIPFINISVILFSCINLIDYIDICVYTRIPLIILYILIAYIPIALYLMQHLFLLSLFLWAPIQHPKKYRLLPCISKSLYCLLPRIQKPKSDKETA